MRANIWRKIKRKADYCKKRCIEMVALILVPVWNVVLVSIETFSARQTCWFGGRRILIMGSTILPDGK